MTSTVEFHTNGLARLQVFNPKQYLGYSTDGVTIELDFKSTEILTDAWGDQIPEDVQNMGQEARVTCELVKYDTNVLEAVENRVQGAYAESEAVFGKFPNVASDGSNQIGSFMKQCGSVYPLAVERANDDCETWEEGPFYFYNAYLTGVDTFKVGTRATRHTLTWRCLPNCSGVLFTTNSGDVYDLFDTCADQLPAS
jgi:hypothetical protein